MKKRMKMLIYHRLDFMQFLTLMHPDPNLSTPPPTHNFKLLTLICIM